MAKRSATSELNHDNWDNEDEPEEAGVFQKASVEILETRVIKTAKRRAKIGAESESKPSPFSGFSGFGSVTSNSKASSPFSFLSQNKSRTTDDSNKNGTKPENVSSLNKETQPQFKSFTSFNVNNSSASEGLSKSTTNFSSGSAQKTTSASDTTFKPFEHIFNQSKSSIDPDKKPQNLDLLKDLNLSCSSWISEHLEKNPYCILTPIFKDYEKHLAQLNLNTQTKSNEDKGDEEKSDETNNSKTETEKPFSCSKEESAETNLPEKDKEKEVEKPKEFKFEGIKSLEPPSFKFGAVKSPFESPFSLNQIAAKPVQETVSESKKDDEETEEPPQNEFVPVVEEDSVFDIKCKVFVKKEGSFVSRGVGTLFLKPIKDSKKTQVVVRAHTNLGNILLNFLLTSGMPIQKTGKNNAMIVCIPTPESKPPPVPVLIRVKSSDECDSLIKKLEECRGS